MFIENEKGKNSTVRLVTSANAEVLQVVGEALIGGSHHCIKTNSYGWNA